MLSLHLLDVGFQRRIILHFEKAAVGLEGIWVLGRRRLQVDVIFVALRGRSPFFLYSEVFEAQFGRWERYGFGCHEVRRLIFNNSRFAVLVKKFDLYVLLAEVARCRLWQVSILI